MIKIPISCPRIPGLFFIVDDIDKRIADLAWGLGTRYPARLVKKSNGCGRKLVCAHNEIIGNTGGLTVDHIDGDIFNNTRGNLDVVSLDENKRRNGRRSLINGVRLSNTLGLWCVFHRQANNHRLHSVYSTPEEAIEAKRILLGA